MNALFLIGSTVSSTVRVIFYALGALVFFFLLSGGYNLWKWLPLRSWQASAFAPRGDELAGVRLRRDISTTGAGQRIETLRCGTPNDTGEVLHVTFVTASGDEAARPLPKVRGLMTGDFEFSGMIQAPRGRRWELATRYGVLDASDHTLDIGGRRRSCVVFRSRHEGPIHIEGRHCPEAGVSPQPTRAACLVHGIRATRSLGHPALDRAMARIDAATSACTADHVGGTDFGPRRRGR